MPLIRYLLLVPTFTVACSRFTDPAVDLGRCLAAAAERVPQQSGASDDVTCHVRSGRSVTAILSQGSGNSPLADSTIMRLEASGVPRQAFYYAGPDHQSVGHKVPLKSVSVYDSHFADNRRYSSTSAVGANVRINVMDAKTSNEFVLRLIRASDGKVDVVGIR